MAVKLSFDERKWLLKYYWNVENVVEVQGRWTVEFGTPPPTRVTITRIRDKFEVDGMVRDVLKNQTEHAINDITLGTIQSVRRSVRRRCWECTVAKGGHFEHLQPQGSLRNRNNTNCISISFRC